MKLNITIFLLFLVFIKHNTWCQDISQITRYNYKDYIQQAPRFTIYGDNYLVTGARLNDNPSEDTSDARFEIGFKERLVEKPLPWDIYLFLTYRQKAFWDIYKNSFPFRALNYNPGLGLGKLIFNKENRLDGAFWFQFEHESNGEAGEISRSWNRLSLSYFLPFNDKTVFTFKAWLPIGTLSDNPDITDYLGYGEASVAYHPNHRWVFEGTFRKGMQNWKGSIQLGINFKISKTGNEFIYLQYFQGYGQDLINYDRDLGYLRIGFSIKDMDFNFY